MSCTFYFTARNIKNLFVTRSVAMHIYYAIKLREEELSGN